MSYATAKQQTNRMDNVTKWCQRCSELGIVRAQGRFVVLLMTHTRNVSQVLADSEANHCRISGVLEEERRKRANNASQQEKGVILSFCHRLM
jgi:hypothetical protein